MDFMSSFFSPKPIPAEEAARIGAEMKVKRELEKPAKKLEKLTNNYYQCLKFIEVTINVGKKERVTCSEMLDRDIQKLTEAKYGVFPSNKFVTVVWGEEKKNFKPPIYKPY